MISFASVNGPSVTVNFPSASRTRTSSALGWNPSVATRTPLFVSSSMSLPIAAMSSGVGPAAAARTSCLYRERYRIVVSFGWGSGRAARSGDRGMGPGSTSTSNDGTLDRHAAKFILLACAPAFGRSLELERQHGDPGEPRDGLRQLVPELLVRAHD